MFGKSKVIAIACFSMFACCETFGAMDALTDDVMIRSEILGGVDWKSVYNSTNDVVPHSTSTASAYGGGGIIDWTDVKDDALKGSPVAQFCLYQYLYRMSSKYTNGTKEGLKSNALMLLLISSIKGGFHKSKDDLAYRTTTTLKTLTLDGSTEDIIGRLQTVISEMLESE
jgi:hypothetical protein